ncbi:MAG: cupin domain-containing protein [Erysipelotrichaceae bacterium]|nr:cupin domain-containing protein [Erysipelotrichaceae bacterium]
MKIIESGIFESFEGDIISDQVKKTCKLYESAKGFYESIDESLSDDTIMYEVTGIDADKQEEGYLNWAISLLHPLTVNGECNMTRGHFHNDLNCEEYYWCAKGEGLLMLMNEEGECWCEKMHPGTLHHINGHHGHRLINTGDEDLKVICVWNANAGHDYERIEKHPFPYRVYKDGNKITVKSR